MDVEVRAPADAVLGDVLPVLAAELALPAGGLWSGTTELPADVPLSSPALRHGAVLGLGRPGPRPASASGALEVHVVGGPDAGRVLPLGRGDLVVGRGPGCGLALRDPDVSRRHVLLSVTEGQVTAADLGSSNGSVLDVGGRPSVLLGGAPVPWPVGALVRIGASTLRLTGPQGAALETGEAPGGRLLVRPLRPAPAALPEVAVRLPAAPPEPAGRRLAWVAVALPAAGGVLMAWLTGTPHFLFFALLSPVVAVAGWWSDWRTGRRAHRGAVAEHAAALARAEEEVDAAVAADLAAREARHPDPARLASAARRRSSPLWSRTRCDDDQLTVRVGTGSGPTAVTRVAPDGTRSAAVATHLPVTVDLRSGGLGVVGPRPAGLGVVRAVVAQLAALLPPGELRLVLVCGVERSGDWRWARWLPQLGQLRVPATGPSPLAGPPDGVTVVVLDGALGDETAAAVRAGTGTLAVLEVAEDEPGLRSRPTALLRITGETGTSGRLDVPSLGSSRPVVLDGMPDATAGALARHLAALAAPSSARGLPDMVRLLDLPATGLRIPLGAVTAAGEWDAGRGRLVTTLGVGEQGPLEVDLVAQGPHALVAGTTGAGKSELLQTLVAGLALRHPPDRCSLLLVDYKGGAAFAATADLPHTVGVLTDLDHQSTARALRSLAAELTSRERLLARNAARDLTDLPDSAALARLVIVVDEFATLAEELPAFVSGLVGIAQRGRSLGVHLVLATQRPSGVVSPEIRANCSLRICLRTTDESESRDVLGSPLAASLPPDRPGRALLRAGSATPVLLQVARVSGTSDQEEVGVTARRRPWPPSHQAARAPVPPFSSSAGPEDLRRLVQALSRRAAERSVARPGRPWLPPLPDRLTAEDLDGGDLSAAVLRIGLTDSPDTQSQQPLELDLAAGGGWLLVGGPRSGRTTALATVTAEAAHRLSPRELHVHVLDHGGGAAAAAAACLPHLGTAVGRGDAHRAHRLVTRLVAEVDRRRSGSPPDDDPLLLVLVDGFESVAAQLDEADPAGGSSALLRLLRDGAAAGLTVVATAERAVPGSRLTAAARSRVVLPLPDRADYAVAGIPPRAVPGHQPPGRALAGEDAVECQLALPRTRVREWPTADDARRIRVVELPADPVLPPAPRERGSSPDVLQVALGPGGDDGRPVGLDLQRSGGLLVVGGPGSGRSTVLASLGLGCRAAGRAVLHLAARPGGVDAGAGIEWMSPADPAALRTWVAQQAPVPVVLADDVAALPDAAADVLASVGRPGGEALVVAAGSAADLAAAYRGPAVTLRRSRTALLLRPVPGDAELLGLRVPRTPLPPRPGSGWLVAGGEAVRVQVARHRAPR